MLRVRTKSLGAARITSSTSRTRIGGMASRAYQPAVFDDRAFLGLTGRQNLPGTRVI